MFGARLGFHCTDTWYARALFAFLGMTARIVGVNPLDQYLACHSGKKTAILFAVFMEFIMIYCVILVEAPRFLADIRIIQLLIGRLLRFRAPCF